MSKVIFNYEYDTLTLKEREENTTALLSLLSRHKIKKAVIGIRSKLIPYSVSFSFSPDSSVFVDTDPGATNKFLWDFLHENFRCCVRNGQQYQCEAWKFIPGAYEFIDGKWVQQKKTSISIICKVKINQDECDD